MKKQLDMEKRNISKSWYYIIKYVAIITMVIDHLGSVLLATNSIGLESYLLIKMIGRIAFPLFAYELVESFYFTKDRKKHLCQIGFLAIISEFVFDITLVNNPALNLSSDMFSAQNTCCTLFLGFLMLILIEKVHNTENVNSMYKYYITLCIVGVTAYIAYICNTDYSWRGILLIALFNYAKYSKNVKLGQIVAMIFFVISMIGNLPFYLTCIISLWLICLANDKWSNEKLEKALCNKPMKILCSYFYPIHLFLLAIIKIVLEKKGF